MPRNVTQTHPTNTTLPPVSCDHADVDTDVPTVDDATLHRTQQAGSRGYLHIGAGAAPAGAQASSVQQAADVTVQVQMLADWLKPRLERVQPAAAGGANGTPAVSRRAMLTAAQAAFVQQYFNDPEAFVKDCIKFPPGRRVFAYQGRLLAKVAQHRRVSGRGPRGLGKSACMAWIILWFALTRDLAGIDWKIPTTASVDRQLTKYLWPEVHKWARKLDWTKIPRRPFNKDELMVFSLRLDNGEAFKVVSNDPEKIEGAHADELLYIFDESKAIVTDVFDALEGAFSVGNVRVVAVSTPGAPVGRFYDIQSGARGYEDWQPGSMRVTAQEIIAEGNTIFEEWRQARKRQWGENSAVFITQCDGEFATDDADTVIPHAWIQLANERWLELADKYAVGVDDAAYGRFDGAVVRALDGAALISAGYPFVGVGVDVGMGNENSARSTLAPRFGDIISEVRSLPHESTMGTTGRAWGAFMKWATHDDTRPHGKLVVDANGVGAGVLHRLQEMVTEAGAGGGGGGLVQGFMAQEATEDKDISGELGFVNLRSYAWWHLRERLDPAGNPTIALPPDTELMGDLVAPRYKVTSGGRIQVESKDTIMPRLGRSTDIGDAVVMIMASTVLARKRLSVMWV